MAVCGFSSFLVSDIDEGRLRVAKEMGATYTLKVTSRDSLALAKEVESTLGCRPQQTIECSGAEPSIATAIYVRICTVLSQDAKTFRGERSHFSNVTLVVVLLLKVYIRMQCKCL